jgi:GntR family transcriptional regulator, carbon starvation induced regulator
MARKPALRASADADGASAITRATAVYESLRADIADGVLEPGSKLRVEAIGARYGVGASPLREALSRLSAEGLVLRSDQRGFSVAPLDWDELPVLTETRVRLESLALRDAIAAHSPAWEDRLVLIVHRLGRTPRSLAAGEHHPNPEWESLHRDFHRTLLAPCPSRWLRGYCAQLADEAYRVRQLAVARSPTRRNEHAEHQAIFEAAIAGRADEATALLAAHYRRTSEIVARARRSGRPAAR